MIKKLKKLLIKNKPRVSIDIGSKNINIVEGSFNNDFIDILNTVEIPTPPNTYDDGQLIDIDLLSKVIGDALLENDIKSKDSIYTIMSSTILNRTIELPSTKDEDIKNMLEFEIGQHFPINLEEYVAQSKVIEKTEGEAAKSIVVVSALPKIIIEEYLKLAEALDLNPLYLDSQSNALSKLMSEEFRINGELDRLIDSTIAVLDIGFNYTNIVMIEKGNFKFNRIVDFGGKDIDINIANSFNISVEEAESKKKEIKDLGVEEENISLNLMKDIIESTIENLYGEINNIFRYYTSRSIGNEIESIYICGSTSKIGGLEKHIEERLDIPTQTLENLGIIEASKFEDADLIQYLNAIGAFIRK